MGADAPGGPGPATSSAACRDRGGSWGTFLRRKEKLHPLTPNRKYTTLQETGGLSLRRPWLSSCSSPPQNQKVTLAESDLHVPPGPASHPSQVPLGCSLRTSPSIPAKASLYRLATSSSSTFLALESLKPGTSLQTHANPSYTLTDAGEKQEKCPSPPTTTSLLPAQRAVGRLHRKSPVLLRAGLCRRPRLPGAVGSEGQRGTELPTANERVSDHPPPRQRSGGAQLAASIDAAAPLHPLPVLWMPPSILHNFRQSCSIRSRASCEPSCKKKLF